MCGQWKHLNMKIKRFATSGVTSHYRVVPVALEVSPNFLRYRLSEKLLQAVAFELLVCPYRCRTRHFPGLPFLWFFSKSYHRPVTTKTSVASGQRSAAHMMALLEIAGTYDIKWHIWTPACMRVLYSISYIAFYSCLVLAGSRQTRKDVCSLTFGASEMYNIKVKFLYTHLSTSQATVLVYKAQDLLQKVAVCLNIKTLSFQVWSWNCYLPNNCDSCSVVSCPKHAWQLSVVAISIQTIR